jgi:hypothetical protein
MIIFAQMVRTLAKQNGDDGINSLSRTLPRPGLLVVAGVLAAGMPCRPNAVGAPSQGVNLPLVPSLAVGAGGLPVAHGPLRDLMTTSR